MHTLVKSPWQNWYRFSLLQMCSFVKRGKNGKSVMMETCKRKMHKCNILFNGTDALIKHSKLKPKIKRNNFPTWTFLSCMHTNMLVKMKPRNIKSNKSKVFEEWPMGWIKNEYIPKWINQSISNQSMKFIFCLFTLIFKIISVSEINWWNFDFLSNDFFLNHCFIRLLWTV